MSWDASADKSVDAFWQKFHLQTHPKTLHIHLTSKDTSKDPPEDKFADISEDTPEDNSADIS